MAITRELYELITKIVDDRVKEIKVTREEFDKLRISMEKALQKSLKLWKNLH